MCEFKFCWELETKVCMHARIYTQHILDNYRCFENSKSLAHVDHDTRRHDTWVTIFNWLAVIIDCVVSGSGVTTNWRSILAGIETPSSSSRETRANILQKTDSKSIFFHLLNGSRVTDSTKKSDENRGIRSGTMHCRLKKWNKNNELCVTEHESATVSIFVLFFVFFTLSLSLSLRFSCAHAQSTVRTPHDSRIRRQTWANETTTPSIHCTRGYSSPSFSVAIDITLLSSRWTSSTLAAKRMHEQSDVIIRTTSITTEVQGD